MHDLPLPRTVVPLVSVATAVLVLWVAWESLRDPETLWAPGAVSRYHAAVAGCSSCHTPFRGPMTAQCVLCHSEPRFAAEAGPWTAAFHADLLRREQSCLACHTEHRGKLGSLTAANPHGDWIFLGTGTSSCLTCHEFEPVFGRRPMVLNNEVVLRLMAKGGGAHRPGQMASCTTCHTAGRRSE
ncbi:MAG TPA: cytochrome c3 family protein [Nitrospira sp.]|nr:cytochrome c3 family protein [Nitrospira sp.]